MTRSNVATCEAAKDPSIEDRPLGNRDKLERVGVAREVRLVPSAAT